MGNTVLTVVEWPKPRSLHPTVECEPIGHAVFLPRNFLRLSCDGPIGNWPNLLFVTKRSKKMLEKGTPNTALFFSLAYV
jgi:hypothetical protein